VQYELIENMRWLSEGYTYLNKQRLTTAVLKMELKNRSFQYGKCRFRTIACMPHLEARGDRYMSCILGPLSQNLSWCRSPCRYLELPMFSEPGVKINGAYYRDVLLGQHLPVGDSFCSKRLLHFQCSSSPSLWHRGVFVSQHTRFYLTFTVVAQQPWTKSRGLWGVGRAPATHPP